MDISNEYINMCFKAEQYLRKLYEFQEGDWIMSFHEQKPMILSSKVIKVNDNVGMISIAIPKKMTLTSPILESQPEMNMAVDRIDFEVTPKECWFRLHRQDQLQDMMGGFPFCIRGLVQSWEQDDNPLSVSGEQLTLKHLMNIKFGLLWYAYNWTDFKIHKVRMV